MVNNKFTNSLRVLLLIAVVIGFQSCSSKKEIRAEIPKKVNKFAFDFVSATSLSPVLDLAAKEGKLVFIDVYTSWCLPCKMMDEDVFTNQTTADIINDNFISYKVDAEKGNGPDLNLIYGVTQYPTLLFVDSRGRILEKGEGAHYHTQLIELANSAIEKSRASD